MNRNAAGAHDGRHLLLEPGAPLWTRVPTRDEAGRPLADFMMIIPRLGRRPAQTQREAIAQINAVLCGYAEHIVFADLNLKLNVLWVTLRPTPGICLEVSAAIHAHIPEARLVAPQVKKRAR